MADIGVGRTVQPPAFAIFMFLLIYILSTPVLIGSLSHSLALLFAFLPHLKDLVSSIPYLTSSKRNRLLRLFPGTSG